MLDLVQINSVFMVGWQICNQIFGTIFEKKNTFFFPEINNTSGILYPTLKKKIECKGLQIIRKY